MRKSERKENKNNIRNQIQETLGQIIAEKRRAADFSQEDLAYEAGIDRSFMSKLERGTSSASIISLFQIANGLDIKVSELIIELEMRLEKEKQ